MHPPLSQAPGASALPESRWVLPESSSVTVEPESPLEDPPLEELPLEEPLPAGLPLEEPLPEELPLEAPPPPEGPLGAAPSFDSMGSKAPGELVEHAGSRGAVKSAKPQMTTDRAFMLRVSAIPMPRSN